jgi:electron transfer flavoprotein beta subunit
MPGPGGRSGPVVAVCLKWVDRRPEVDALTGAVGEDERFAGASDADRAALELALQLSQAWGGEVVAVTAGPTGAERLLRDALSCGAARVVRVDLPAGTPSETVAVALASVLGDAAFVLCGDYSSDRGSGSVPAYLAAHLHLAQALGLVELAAAGSPDAPRIEAVRRLDGGRRERLVVDGRGVLSVEGSLARLRRAPLAATLRARTAPIEVVPGPPLPDHAHGARRSAPYRPRARALAAPVGDTARERVLHLTAALSERTPPRVLALEPAAAADAIVEALRQWGELPG